VPNKLSIEPISRGSKASKLCPASMLDSHLLFLYSGLLCQPLPWRSLAFPHHLHHLDLCRVSVRHFQALELPSAAPWLVWEINAHSAAVCKRCCGDSQQAIWDATGQVGKLGLSRRNSAHLVNMGFQFEPHSTVLEGMEVKCLNCRAILACPGSESCDKRAEHKVDFLKTPNCYRPGGEGEHKLRCEIYEHRGP